MRSRFAFGPSALRSRLNLERLECRDLPAFVTPPVYPAGTNPTAMVAHDFNGDGLQDIAVTNQTTPGKVSVLLNTGGGVFGTAKDFPTGGLSPGSIAIGDVNGDGRTDLVVTNTDSGTVGILRGSGTGVFRRPITFAAGSLPSEVVVRDLNADGALDLAVANRTTAGTVSILINNGNGTFQPAVAYGSGNSTRSVTVADFNNDTKLDLAVANTGDGTFGILLGNGDGTFQTMSAFGIGAQPFAVVAGDFNTDGNQDVATMHSLATGLVSVVLGTGGGTFQGPASYLGVGANPVAMRLADVNGDAKVDVVTANQGWSTVSVLLAGGPDVFEQASHYIAQTSAAGLVVADFDGAAPLDFAISTLAGTGIAVIASDGGPYPAATNYPLNYDSGPTKATAADLNSDGAVDIVVPNSGYSAVGVLLGNGDGSFKPSADYNTNNGSFDLAVADFDVDGVLDLAVLGNAVSVLLGRGDGSFKPPLVTFTFVQTADILAGDFNEDGKPDIALARNHDKVGVALGNGDGTFQSIIEYGADDPYFLALADMNGDGNQDIVATHYPSGISVMLGNGDGTFDTAAFYPTVGDIPHDVVIGDYNGDGNQDMATLISNFVTVLLGAGDGTFFSAEGYAAGAKSLGLAAGDINQDGALDFAVSHYSPAATVSVLLGTGDGTFQPRIDFIGPPGTDTPAVADFDGDDLPDLAFPGAKSVTVYINAADWGPAPIENPNWPGLSPASKEFETKRALLADAITARQAELRPVSEAISAKAQNKPTFRIIRAIAPQHVKMPDEINITWNP